MTKLVEVTASGEGGTIRGDRIDRLQWEEQRGKFNMNRAGIVSGGSPRR